MIIFQTDKGKTIAFDLKQGKFFLVTKCGTYCLKDIEGKFHLFMIERTVERKKVGDKEIIIFKVKEIPEEQNHFFT